MNASRFHHVIALFFLFVSSACLAMQTSGETLIERPVTSALELIFTAAPPLRDPTIHFLDAPFSPSASLFETIAARQRTLAQPGLDARREQSTQTHLPHATVVNIAHLLPELAAALVYSRNPDAYYVRYGTAQKMAAVYRVTAPWLSATQREELSQHMATIARCLGQNWKAGEPPEHERLFVAEEDQPRLRVLPPLPAARMRQINAGLSRVKGGRSVAIDLSFAATHASVLYATISDALADQEIPFLGINVARYAHRPRELASVLVRTLQARFPNIVVERAIVPLAALSQLTGSGSFTPDRPFTLFFYNISTASVGANLFKAEKRLRQTLQSRFNNLRIFVASGVPQPQWTTSMSEPEADRP